VTAASRRPEAARRFPTQLRGGIRRSGLTLEQLQLALAERGHRIGRSTLSYWQNGQRLPSGAASNEVAITHLESVLALPAGTLVDALAEPRSPTSAEPLVGSDSERIVRLFEQIGCVDQATDLDLSALVCTGAYGPRGQLVRMETLLAVRARTDIDRYPVLHAGEPGADARLIDVEMLAGGRIGRVRRDPESPLVVAEVILDQTLRRGETHLLRYAVHDANEVASDGYFGLVDTPRTFFALEVRFHPGCLPVRVEEFERASDRVPDRLRRDRALGMDRTVTVVRDRGRPGLVGLRWHYA